MNIEEKIKSHVDDARDIFRRRDVEQRQLTPDERVEVEQHLAAVDKLKAQAKAQTAVGELGRDIGTGSHVTATDPRASLGSGWDRLASAIDLKAGKVKAQTPLAGLMRRKDLTGVDEFDFPPVRAPGVATGVDTRYLYPSLATQMLGTELSVQEFKQVGSASVTGSVERSPTDTGTKAEVDVQLELASEQVKQVAAVISDVPNAILASDVTLRAFLQQQLRVKLDQAIDQHCLNQIDNGSFAGGAAGANLIEEIRNGVSAMAAVGTRPTLVAVSPVDAVELDLFTVGPSDNEYLFPVRDSGSSSPLFGLRVVECASVTDPILIDPVALGLLYVGQASFEVDPYSGFKENLSTVRLEGNVLFHVRNGDGAYTIGGS